MTRHLSPVRSSPERAVIYCRQSISKEDSISIELQESACRDYAVQRGYVVTEVITDPGISGRTWNRPGVRRVMELVESGAAEVVLVWKWSRVSRSRHDWAVAVDRFDVAGGRLESATEPVDAATATGRFTRGMLAEMAAFESDRIGEVWKEVHARRRSHGLPASGGARFGYQRVDAGYVAHPVEGPLLAAAYARIVDGHSFRDVVGWLNASGARTREGNPFTRDRLVRVLDSGFGAGLLVRMGRRGRAISRNVNELEWVSGAHPAVITPDQWEAYLALRRVQVTPGPRGSYLLSGLVVCGDCGSPMWSDRLGREPGYGYVCSRWRERRDRRCVTTARARAEATVVEWLGDYAQACDARAESLLSVPDTSDSRVTERSALLREARRLEDRQHRLLSAYLDGTVPSGAYEAERDRIAHQLSTVTRQIDILAVRARAPGRPEIYGDVLEDWPILPLADRRAMVRSVIDAVVVIPPARRGQRSSFLVVARP